MSLGNRNVDMESLSKDLTYSLENIFYPGSIAIIGGLDLWVDMLMDFGYPGTIYPVHPHQEEVGGLKVYSALSHVPDPIDFAILSVPASLFPQVIQDCAAKGIKTITSPACGFSEAEGSTPVSMPSPWAMANARSLTWAAFKARRWSALAPVTDGVASAT